MHQWKWNVMFTKESLCISFWVLRWFEWRHPKVYSTCEWSEAKIGFVLAICEFSQGGSIKGEWNERKVHRVKWSSLQEKESSQRCAQRANEMKGNESLVYQWSSMEWSEVCEGIGSLLFWSLLCFIVFKFVQFVLKRANEITWNEVKRKFNSRNWSIQSVSRWQMKYREMGEIILKVKYYERVFVHLWSVKWSLEKEGCASVNRKKSLCIRFVKEMKGNEV